MTLLLLPSRTITEQNQYEHLLRRKVCTNDCEHKKCPKQIPQQAYQFETQSKQISLRFHNSINCPPGNLLFATLALQIAPPPLVNFCKK